MNDDQHSQGHSAGQIPPHPERMAWSARTTLQHWLVTRIAERQHIAPERIDKHETFASYGLSSRDMVSIAGDLAVWLDRSLPPSLLYDYPSIQRLTAFLMEADQPHTTAPAFQMAEQRPVANTEPIAIVGLGCRFPGNANTPEAFWDVLARGYNAVSEIPRERWESQRFYDPDPQKPGKMYTRSGAFLNGIDQFDAPFFAISPREAMRMDPQQRLLLEVAWEAFEQAGLSSEKLSGSRTGVFIGMMANHEYALMQKQGNDQSSVNDPYYGLGSASSVASGRISYFLNLRGPCLTIDTACSSSLVALHMACQSLRTGECDSALAGGVHTLLQPELLVNFCKMGMLAPDGQCKTFDAAADGFVFGEGCGLVVLKRLADAQNDGNPILALIRGSAVNQDGRSNGITAPNLLAQVDVLRSALAAANLSPEQVSYIEAHGSGTELGDAIEIGAVEKVYGAHHTADHRLLIGSVKTNIGHLAGAAGIAGIIKTVLALRAGQIPAHLNVQRLNPHLVPAFEHALALPTTLQAWPEVQGPHRAGVSSFSWSGTNAHVLLEEAPAPRPTPTTRSWHTLQLSARSASALDMATHNLAEYVRAHQEEIRLPDLAYTCNVGRSSFAYRRSIICQSIPEAITRLEECEPVGESAKTQTDGSSSVTFLFPGLGEHYIDMGKELYEQEPVFRECVEQCALLLRAHLKLDIREILYPDPPSQPAPAQVEHERLDFRALLGRNQEATLQSSAVSRLNQTMYAQPALFVVEYALAQLWLSWGIQPRAMMGHSLGEYVAACLAGVLSLEDALLLVAHRARLIQNLPPGGMLAVMLTPAEIVPFLSTEISLAAVNSYQTCVLAGPLQALAQVELRLTERGIVYRRLPTSHAFHSTMMVPIQRALAALVSVTTLHPPRIPYISNVTGTWITAEQATDPTYWLQHLCQTVQFADGLHVLLQQADGVLLEVGPGQGLCSFALQQAVQEKIPGLVALPSLRHAYERRSDQAVLAKTLGQLWSVGVQIEWHNVYAREQPHMLPLPTYPFEHQRYWIPLAGAPAIPQPTPGGKQADIADWFYMPVWRQTPYLPSSSTPVQASEHWLLCADACGVAIQLASRLRQKGHDVTVVQAGNEWQKSDPQTYVINNEKAEDYKSLLQDLQRSQRLPHRIVFLWAVTPPDQSALTPRVLEDAQRQGLYSLLYLIQALGTIQSNEDRQCLVISNDMQDVSGLEMLRPEKATLLGMCKVLAKEYPHLTCRSIDIELSSDGLLAETQLEHLLDDLSAPHTEDSVAYRGRHRWTQTYEAQRLAQVSSDTLPYKEYGVYLITGGLGGLGLALAEYLARHWHAKLVLLSRTAFPPREQWPQWLAAHDAQDTISTKIRQLQTLEQLGAEVMLIHANIAEAAQVQQAIRAVHARFGALQGVFHLAGLPGEGLIQLKTREKIEQVLSPKVQGSLTLAEAVRAEPLDFLVLYSSSIIITGGLGEMDYAAANSFLDAFATYCSSRYGWPCFAIHWGPWQWDSWQSRLYAGLAEGQARIKEVREAYGISFAEGIEALTRILASPLKHVAVLTQTVAETRKQWDLLSSPDLLVQPPSGQPMGTRYARPQLKNPYVAPRHPDEQKIAAIWQEALGIESIGINDHFFELGGNSLIGLVVVARLAQEFQVQLNAVSLFEGPTISSLLKIIKPDQQAAPQSMIPAGNRGKMRKERMRIMNK